MTKLRGQHNKHTRNQVVKGKPIKDARSAKLGPPYLSNIRQRYVTAL